MFLLVHSAKLVNSDYICTMKSGLFYFKKFSVSHSQSSMKVGVDGVLIGAWAGRGGVRMLDVGTGCALIALMLAQRFPSAGIDAIDIDSASVAEAKENIERSPWGDRVCVMQSPFSSLYEECSECYDLIVSNPPYFDSGVNDFSSARNIARHKGSLSPETLLACSSHMLRDKGRLSMIFPSEYFSKLRLMAPLCGMSLDRATYVKDGYGSVAKRVMAEFIKKESESSCADADMTMTDEVPTLVMFEDDRQPTDEYRRLCGDFYLKF